MNGDEQIDWLVLFSSHVEMRNGGRRRGKGRFINIYYFHFIGWFDHGGRDSRTEKCRLKLAGEGDTSSTAP